MQTIQADEAEARFKELLREVEGGTAFVVTRDGVPIALMTPARATPEQVASIVEDWERYRSEHNVVLGRLAIRDLIEMHPD